MKHDAYERVFLGIAIVAVAVWAVATLVQVVFPNHPAPEYANLAMMAVVTFFFGGGLVASNRRRKSGDREPQ